MKVLFCGSALPESAEVKLKYLSNAGNKFQHNMINAINGLDHEVFLCSYVGIPVEREYYDSFSVLYKQLGDGIFVSNDKSSESTRRSGEGTDNVNEQGNGVWPTETYVFKGDGNRMSGANRYKKICNSIINEIKPDILICYNPIYPFFSLPGTAAKKGIVSILVLADYATADSFKSMISLRSIIGRVKSAMELKCIRGFDKVVGLSENVRSFLKKEQGFINIEGGIDSQKWIDFPKPDIATDKIRFMYSGLFSNLAGVEMAIEAFEKIDSSDVELHITGIGDLKDAIMSYASKDERIIFHGRLEYNEYIDILKKSHILLNPRDMRFPENQYNFPSKMLEYLATGRVIVSTRFAGWQNFSENAFFTDSTAGDFSKGMKNALFEYGRVSNDVYMVNRKKAVDYDWKKQAKRLLSSESYI
ncbi:MAG: glycosyltransferase [Lachnospiraceae bacterium]|nr:glycosyltransferase [Lachnospiraceae bacterium]